MRMMNRSGLTLMEILVAMTLLAAGAFAVMGGFVSAAKLAEPEPKRYTALNIARVGAENLNNVVRQDCEGQWGISPKCKGDWRLDADGTLPTPAAMNVDNVNYTPRYEVEEIDADASGGNYDYKKVKMKVKW